MEGFHDTLFEHPARQLRDVVTKDRALLAAAACRARHAPAAAPPAPRPAARSPHSHLGRGARPAHDPGGRRTRRRLDPALVARDRLPSWAAELARLRHAAAPHARALTVAAGPLTVADQDPASARKVAAACTAWYLSAMGDVYARSLSGQGFAAEVRAILDANPRPSPRHGTVPAASQVILDQLAAYGTGGQVREQLQLWDHTADIVVILLPPGIPWHNIEATLRAAAPSARPGPACCLQPGAVTRTQTAQN